jgi:4-carboxymuconolactone decarboxylase
VTDDSRLPLLHPDAMNDEQHEIYEAITRGQRPGAAGALSLTDSQGRLHGPFNAMICNPTIGAPLLELGTALRFRSSFTKREREIATLVAAAHHRSDFEWHAHSIIGAAAGLTEAELDALRTEADPVLGDPRERIVYEASRALVTDGDMIDALYGEAAAVLGRSALVELVALMGYYAALALQMRVFRVGLPDGATAPSWET